MDTPDDFKRGTLFRHGTWQDPVTREKVLCRVTAIRYGQVYYGFGKDATTSAFYASAERLLENGAEIVSA